MERTKLTVSSLFQERLHQALLGVGPAVEKAEQNCRYRLDFSTAQGWVRVKQFTNGTLYVEATDAAAYNKVMAVISDITGQTVVNAPKVASPAKAASPERGKIEMTEPYIGTDESGKGDYFGPLVIAGVYVTPKTAQILETLGVMDSKRLKDNHMAKLAGEIQTVVGEDAFGVIEIGPKRYNELYTQFKQRGRNLNHLLAWGHAKVLENLLAKNPDCVNAIADQFGSEHYIQSQLQTLGQQIRLQQTPKAEANIGVAAASILARVRFVNKLGALGNKWGLSLPPGASAAVTNAALQIVRRHGEQALGEVAKLHFKTTETVLAKV